MKKLAEKLKSIDIIREGEFPMPGTGPHGQFTEAEGSQIVITVTLGNDAMQTEEEAAEAISMALAKGWDFVKDANGNKVGTIKRS